MGRSIRIGGASGFWGESSHATGQLLGTESLDFIVYDYLAEITMAILARARAKDRALGFATDFVSAALAPNIVEIARQGVRIVSNAGGVNPKACGEAVRKLVADKGLDLKVAVVTGDDLTDRAGEFGGRDTTEMFSGEAFPDVDKIASINAYLGAFPIAEALNQGADIVITGRCVDSAVTLGACIHSFGWTPDAYDRLATGALAGHVLECGPQATGGNFTDWRQVGDISKIGYPIAEVRDDGQFVVSKPENTTGLVSPASVGEQMLYEIGDPQSYVLPDVICDFSQVTLEQDGADRVLVSNAGGRPPSGYYKVSATFADGFRAGYVFNFNGFEARAKAEAFAAAGVDKTRAILRSMNAPDFNEICIETTGGETGGVAGYEEVCLKAAVWHRDARAIGLFLKEMIGMALATPPGLSGFTGAGRPKPSPVVRLFSFLIRRENVPVQIDMGSGAEPFAVEGESVEPKDPDRPLPPVAEPAGTMVSVPLIRLAVARSGDKGDKANIGVMARAPEYMPWIWSALTEETIGNHFSDVLKGGVERFYMPGSHAMNIVLDRVLGGGGVVSLRNDPQGKGFAQRLLACPIAVPERLAAGLQDQPDSNRS